MNIKPFLIFAALAICLPGRSSAGTDNAPVITVSLQTLGMGVMRSDLFIKNGEQYVHLDVVLDALSYKVVPYTGPFTMPLFVRVKAGKDTAYNPVAQVTFPPPVPDKPNEFILLFAPSPDNKPSIGLFRNDKVSFPADSVRVINVMRVPTGIKVNQTVGILQPGESKVLAMGKNADKAEIHIAVAKGDHWIEVSNNVFPLAEEYRRTIFVIDVTSEGAPHRKLPLITLVSMAEAKIKPAPQAEDKTVVASP